MEEMLRDVVPPRTLAPRGKAPRGGGRLRGAGGMVAPPGVLVLGARAGRLGVGAAQVVGGPVRDARVRGAGVGAPGMGSRAASR